MSGWGRPLARFVGDMAEALERNDHKGGWRHLSMPHLLHRVRQEVAELEREIRAFQQRRGDLDVPDEKWVEQAGPPALLRIRREAADAANFCLMISDLAREFEAELSAAGWRPRE